MGELLPETNCHSRNGRKTAVVFDFKEVHNETA